MSRILVVGVEGAIGSSLYAECRRLHYFVWGTSRRQDRQSSFLYLDLLKPPPLATKEKFDIVFMCAGMSSMDFCENNPELSYKINVIETKAWIEWFKSQGAYLVYLSTNQVFSGDKPFVPAHTLPDPQHAYGKQKAEVEAFIIHHYPNYAIVRLTKVLAYPFKRLMEWKKALLNNQGIEPFKDMKLAPVALSQLLRVLIALIEKKPIGIIQVSGKEDKTYYDLAVYLAKQLNKPLDCIQAQSALNQGIKKTFLPLFTSLDSSSMIALCNEYPQSMDVVLAEYFNQAVELNDVFIEQ